MTKEELLSTISEELGTTQISERSINEMIEGFGLADNENVTTESLAPYVKFLKQTVTGNISSVVAGAVNEKNAQITALEKQIEDLKKQVPNQQVPPTTQNAELDALKQKIEALENANIEAADKAKISATKSAVKSALKAKLAEAKVVVNDFVFNTTMNGFEITKETKAADAVKELETLYLENLKAAGLAGGYQPRGGGGQGGGDNKTATKNYFARKKAKEGWGK